QLEAGLHIHLWIPALPKSKSGCTRIYQIAGMKKKSSFLLPIFLAFNLLHLLLAEVGGDDVLSPSEMQGKGSAWLPSSLALQRCSAEIGREASPPSCWKIKEILFCFGTNPRGFEVLGGICWPGKAFS
ncbi:hypothetical protein N312_01239, partial [Balearica regulorum gibbericeps]